MAAALTVLVIEDHDILRDATVRAIARAGYHAMGIDCAEALDDEMAGRTHDVYIVDVNLPGEDGLSLVKRIRAAHPLAGIVIASARDRLEDRLEGYRCGADLYLTKPTAPEELLAAISAIGRRVIAAAGTTESPHTPAALQLEAATRRLRGASGEERLSASETALITALSRARDRQMETWQLIEVLGEDPETYPKSSLELRIVRLRQKLVKVGADERCLRALRGVGYQLDTSIEIV